MEKLLKLMNEWQQSFNPGYEFTYKYSEESAREDLNKLSQLKLFIERLVDNKKIDFEKNKLQVLKDIDVRGEVFYDYTLFDKADGVIMLLAISDTPIEDLISYLK